MFRYLPPHAADTGWDESGVAQSMRYAKDGSPCVDEDCRLLSCAGESMRLRILSELRTGEISAGQLAELMQCSQANASKHLSTLLEVGILQREQRRAVNKAMAKE